MMGEIRKQVMKKNLLGQTFYKILIEIILAILVFSILIIHIPAGAYAADDSETAYRIKPLRDQLATMDSADISAAIEAFADMNKHWSRHVVGKLTGLDIIAGVKGRFLPEGPLQADQFLKMAVRAMGYKIEQGTGYWAQPYIDMALKEGLVVKGEIADYKKPLTREQMARIIIRTALKVDAKPDSKYDQYIIGKVNDYHEVADNMKQYVLDAYKLGLITGTNDKFNPKLTLTRAEAAAVIIRFLDVTERKPMQPGPDEVIKLVDNLGNPMEIYPGSIREYWDTMKVTEKLLPIAKGHTPFYYSPETGAVCVTSYASYEAWKQDCVGNVIANFHTSNAYNNPDMKYAYRFDVWQMAQYKELFAGYITEILKAIFEKDADTAIVLHDKYMNMVPDGQNESIFWDTRTINDHKTEFRGNSNGFSITIYLKGQK